MTAARRFLHSDRTDSMRRLARRLGVRGGNILSAEAARRHSAAATAAQRIRAQQLDDHPYLDDPDTLVMGRESYVVPNVRKFRGDTNKVVIGNWCSIGADVDIYVGGMHPVEWVTTYGLREMLGLPGAYRSPMPRSHGDVEVGHDCWIGDRATILSGVQIGNGAVIGADTVVSDDVRPYAIVVGNPAKETRRRFTDAQVEALQRISWWHWDLPTVIERVDDLNGASIDAFIDRYDPGPP